MKSAKLVINIALAVGVLLSVYFLQLSFTPEGYTGIFLWFQYDVHTPRGPAIALAVFVIALVVFNWKTLTQARNRFRLLALFAASAVILVGVFFFLSFKRHNRLPWERPSVIIIDIDTLRADHVSAYGTSNARTPNIDSLAKDGWLFERAFSHIPITLPSHASLFTGRLPQDAWVRNNRDDFAFPKQTLAEILKSEGYQTAGIVSLGVLKSTFNINRGFDFYNDQFPRNGQWFNRANVITDRAIEWMDGTYQEGTPFFLWLHYSDPHEPYDPPGTPPDAALEFDGQELLRGSLDSAARFEATITLQPGVNELTVRPLYEKGVKPYFTQISFAGDAIDNGQMPAAWRPRLEDAERESKREYRQVLRTLQSAEFLRGFSGFRMAGLVFEETGKWEEPEPEANRARRSIVGPAGMRITNTTGAPMTVEVSFKGGVYKELDIVRQQYAGEVEFADREIGRFLDYLKQRGLMDDTIIVFLSDHGEELNEHGQVGHIHNLYTQSLQVPLIVRDPRTDHKGIRIPRTARFIDIAPTILDMVGLHTPDYMQGRTLMEYILRNRSPERPLYAATFQPEAQDNRFGILDNVDLGIFLPDAERIRQFEMYNLTEDPLQWRNTALPPARGNLNEFAARAKKFSESVTIDQGARTVESEREEMLKDLGYLTSSASPAALSDIGVPSTELIANVENTMETIKTVGIVSFKAEPRDIGGGNGHYVALMVELPEDSTAYHVITLQSEVIKTVIAQSRQFPTRLIVRSGERLLLDRMYPGDSRPIIELYSLRLLRLMMSEPFNANIATGFEALYPALTDKLEKEVGLQR